MREIGSNSAALGELQGGTINVLGGTSWMWARADFMNSVHTLLVDEAGQMSLANGIGLLTGWAESCAAGRPAAIGTTTEGQPSGRLRYPGACTPARRPRDNRRNTGIVPE